MLGDLVKDLVDRVATVCHWHVICAIPNLHLWAVARMTPSMLANAVVPRSSQRTEHNECACQSYLPTPRCMRNNGEQYSKWLMAPFVNFSCLLGPKRAQRGFITIGGVNGAGGGWAPPMWIDHLPPSPVLDLSCQGFGKSWGASWSSTVVNCKRHQQGDPNCFALFRGSGWRMCL